ncbi:MAG TPA: PEP-CTERM sorting domain-containing protein [Nostocaceae cyanobacterium]|nr:PEP-CTERM sorting domain-containing protein [Nostocaceae cyanobacterium]
MHNFNKIFLPVVAGLASSFLLSYSAHAATLGQNLIVNGDAEQGSGDPIGNAVGADIPTIPGWNTTGDFSVIKYGATGFNFVNGFNQLVSVTLPGLNVPGPINRGENLFFGGANRASSRATQVINVANLTSIIDAGNAIYDLSGWLGGYSNDQDIPSLNITFLDQASQSLGTASISAPTPAQRNNETGLFFQSTVGHVPISTRQMNVVLNAAYTRGRVNDSFADNLSLVITQVPESSFSAFILIGGFCFAAWKLQKKRPLIH